MSGEPSERLADNLAELGMRRPRLRLEEWPPGFDDRLLWGALLVLSGGFVGLTGAPSPALWLEQGLVTGLLVLVLYAGALRFDLAMVPLAVGTVSALGLIRAALRQGHPAALPGCLLGAALTLLVAWWWTSALRGPSPEPAVSPVPEPSPA